MGADSFEETAEATREAYKLGAGKGKMQRAVAIATRRAKNLKRMSRVLKGANYALAANSAYENFTQCEEEP